MSAAATLRALGQDLLNFAEYDIELGPSESNPMKQTSFDIRLYNKPVEKGVALIGPIRKNIRIGDKLRACRMKTLREIEDISPTALVFDLDNPAPVGFASTQILDIFCARRENQSAAP